MFLVDFDVWEYLAQTFLTGSDLPSMWESKNIAQFSLFNMTHNSLTKEVCFKILQAHTS